MPEMNDLALAFGNERYNDLVKAMVGVCGPLNPAVMNFLEKILKDWQRHGINLPLGHPDKGIDAYTAVLAAIRAAIDTAEDVLPDEDSIQAILECWMRKGFQARKMGRKEMRFQRKKPKKVREKAVGLTAEQLAVIESMHARLEQGINS